MTTLQNTRSRREKSILIQILTHFVPNCFEIIHMYATGTLFEFLPSLNLNVATSKRRQYKP